MDNSVDVEDDDDLPFGRGVSIYGSEDGDGEDVIPQRTPPFTLRYSDPVRTCEERAVSPASSYTSMKSDSLSETGEEHEQSSTVVRLERRDSSALSSDSFISDEDDVAEKDLEQSLRKKSKTENILKQQKAPAPVKPELVVDPNQKRHPAMTVDFAFKALTLCLKKLEEDLKLFKKLLWERYPERFRDPLDGFDLVDLVDKMLELCDIEVSMKIAVALLNFMNAKKLAEYLEGLCKRNEVRYELKLALKRKYEMVCEGYSTHPVPFESVYTELYISNGNEASVNIEHEFRPTIEELKESAKVNRMPLTGNDLFPAPTERTRHVRCVLSKGVPGCGKSFSVQRFILDWANGKVHQDIFFLLPLPFKELNQMLEGEYTVLGLVSIFYPEMKEVESLEFEGCPVLFVCDGLDDTHISFQFRRTMYTCDLGRPMSVQVMMTNLFRGNLLHNVYIWITSRAGSLDVIPPEHVHQLIEVRGFNDDQKEAYFRKTITDQMLAERVIAHIKSSKTLFIMCHSPLFCWVASRLLQHQFQSLPPSAELPKTITTFYTTMLNLTNKTTVEKLQTDPSEYCKGLTSEELLIKLAKLAYGMLEKNEFQIKKKHWQEVGLPDSYPAMVCTSLCMEFYREEHILYTEKVCCFAHPTIQEFMAALHVFYSYKKHGKNVFEPGKRKVLKVSLADVLRSGVDKVLNAENSHFDIFLCFLLGLSVEANQDLLNNLLGITSSSSKNSHEEITHYILKKIKEGNVPEKTETLKRCIDELNPKMQL